MPKSTVEKGKWGEEVALEYLKRKGYKILFQNWRAERGDIDLIVQDGPCIAFVEVKTGSTEEYGPPELRITPGKKRQLVKLATAFLQQAEEYQLTNESYRFDVVVIDGTRRKYQIRHYENAFTA
ncbi:MAG: YraN family protein [Calditrichia bacterium]